jgi:hypothetical protein
LLPIVSASNSRISRDISTSSGPPPGGQLEVNGKTSNAAREAQRTITIHPPVSGDIPHYKEAAV